MIYIPRKLWEKKKKFSGWGRGKILVAGQGNSQTQGIFRAGQGSLENFQGRGGLGQLFFLGHGRAVHPCKVYSTRNCSIGLRVLCVPDDDPVNGFEPEYLSLPPSPLLRSLPLTLQPPSTTPTHPVNTICAFEKSNEFATFTGMIPVDNRYQSMRVHTLLSFSQTFNSFTQESFSGHSLFHVLQI